MYFCIPLARTPSINTERSDVPHGYLNVYCCIIIIIIIIIIIMTCGVP